MKASIGTGQEGSGLKLKNLECVNDEVTCFLEVCSEGFAARRPFYFSQLCKTISELENLDAALEGTVKISADYEDDEIVVECDKFGHVIVSGELYLHSDLYHALKFSFVSDQTFLRPFIRDLNLLRRTDTGEYSD